MSERASAGPTLTRREALRLGGLGPLLLLGASRTSAEPAADLTLASLREAGWRVVSADERAADAASKSVRLERRFEGSFCRPRLANEGRAGVRLREVVLFELPHGLPPATRVYGEGFQMLSQTGGTLAEPADLGDYTDARHYKLPQAAGMSAAVHGLLLLSPPGGEHLLLAFTSCGRFGGELRWRPGVIEVVANLEGLELGAGESWEIEEIALLAGRNREALLAGLAQRLRLNHPPLAFPTPPSGWCSWYCFGPKVTAEQVLSNLEVIARSIPGLKYIQVDDGYQPAMGDWLDTGPAFGGEVQAVLRTIRERGFEPAIWVAPFIAEKDSRLFREHPDWFVKDRDGGPLRADKVTFGGWRRGPWYALDATHPEAQRHLETVFRVMRREWGCSYFKLDANFWGAIHGGVFHDPRATRIEAYRRGMEAVRRGAGDAFLLGCNHPIWPSLGLLHGSRSSNDIKRAWGRVSGTARQNLLRNWQNGRLWWNDPDAVVLTGELSEDEFLFHATAIWATGGMLLSGDDLTQIAPGRLALLQKLQPPTGVAARFDDDSLRVGVVELPGRRAYCLLNWSETEQRLSFRLEAPHRLRELLRGVELGLHGAGEVSQVVPARCGRVLVCTPESA